MKHKKIIIVVVCVTLICTLFVIPSSAASWQTTTVNFKDNASEISCAYYFTQLSEDWVADSESWQHWFLDELYYSTYSSEYISENGNEFWLFTDNPSGYSSGVVILDLEEPIQIQAGTKYEMTVTLGKRANRDPLSSVGLVVGNTFDPSNNSVYNFYGSTVVASGGANQTTDVTLSWYGQEHFTYIDTIMFMYTRTDETLPFWVFANTNITLRSAVVSSGENPDISNEEVVDQIVGGWNPNPQYPSGSNDVSDYISSEQQVFDGAQEGMDTGMSYITGLGSQLNQFSGALLVVTGLLNRVFALPGFSWLLTIGLALGIVAFILNIVPSIGSKLGREDRKRENAQRDRRRGGKGGGK